MLSRTASRENNRKSTGIRTVTAHPSHCSKHKHVHHKCQRGNNYGVREGLRDTSNRIADKLCKPTGRWKSLIRTLLRPRKLPSAGSDCFSNVKRQLLARTLDRWIDPERATAVPETDKRTTARRPPGRAETVRLSRIDATMKGIRGFLIV